MGAYNRGPQGVDAVRKGTFQRHRSKAAIRTLLRGLNLLSALPPFPAMPWIDSLNGPQCQLQTRIVGAATERAAVKMQPRIKVRLTFDRCPQLLQFRPYDQATGAMASATNCCRAQMQQLK